MSILQEFKAFAIKGNVIDMAVGVIIGSAFGKIVSSFVNDVVMPPVGLMIGGMNFADLVWQLKAATAQSPAVVIAYGKFAQTVLDFLIVAWVIFMTIKLANRLRNKEAEEAAEAHQAIDPTPATPPAPAVEALLLAEIRDLLKKAPPQR